MEYRKGYTGLPYTCMADMMSGDLHLSSGQVDGDLPFASNMPLA